MSHNTHITAGPLLVRISLQNLLYFPVKVSQFCGSFVFSLDANAELSFSWWAYPTLLAFLKITLGIICQALFWANMNEYIPVFGNWADVDLFSYMTITISGFLSDAFCTFMSLKNQHTIKKFHSQLVRFIVDIQVDIGHKLPKLLEGNFYHFESYRKNLRAFVLIATIFAFVSYTCATANAVFVAVKYLHSRLLILVTVPLILFYVIGMNIMRHGQYYVLGGILACVSIAMKALHDQCRWELTPFTPNDTALENILKNLKILKNIIRDVNVTFQWMLLTSILTLLINILCFFFQIFTWISSVGVVTALVGIGPALISNIMALYYLCEVASTINRQVHA